MYLKVKYILPIVLLTLLFVQNISFADNLDMDESFSFDELDFSVSSDNKEVPSLNARHAVIFDRNSKIILYGKNENEKCKMASTTKILTALVVLENCPNLDEFVTISSKSAHTGGSRLGLSTNDKISVHDLLYGLLMVSGNDCAVALAEFVGGDVDGFATMMNQKASSLNLNSSHFVTPHGLDQDEHYTTAFELAIISDYALKNNFFSEIVKTQYYTININGVSRKLHNTNELLGNIDGVYGVKTGFTNGANRCLVSSFKKGDLDFICVVLGCDTKKDRTIDSIKLINYVCNNFSVIDVNDIINKEFDNWVTSTSDNIQVKKSVNNSLTFSLNQSQIPFKKMTIKSDSIDTVYSYVDYNNCITAPLASNSVIGYLSINLGNDIILKIDIITNDEICRVNVFDYLNIFFKDYFLFVRPT